MIPREYVIGLIVIVIVVVGGSMVGKLKVGSRCMGSRGMMSAAGGGIELGDLGVERVLMEVMLLEGLDMR